MAKARIPGTRFGVPQRADDPAWLVFLAGLALVAGYAALAWIRAVEPLGLDQGLFALFGRLVPEGWLPYRDLWDSKPPLVLYTYPLAFTLFGERVAALWWFEAAWLGLAVLVAGVMASRLWGRWAGIAAAFLMVAGMWAPGWGGYWARAQAELFLALPLLGAGWFAWLGRERADAPFWCGVLTGIASLYKVPAGLLLAAWPGVWVGTPKGGPWWRKLGGMLLGAAIPWAIVLLYFQLRGGLPEMIAAVFTYNTAYAELIARGSSLPATILGALKELTRTVPVLTIAGTIGLALLVLRRRAEALWLVPWVVATLVAIVLQRQLAGYHFLLAVPGLALAAAYGIVAIGFAIREGGGARILGASALVLLLGLALPQAGRWQAAYGPDLDLRRGRLSSEAYLARFDSNGPFSPAAELAAARVVDDASASRQRLLVWGLSPGIYFHAGRSPATPFAFHNVLLTDSPLAVHFGDLAARRARLIEDLQKDPPGVILVGTRDENGFEREDSYTQMLRFPELRQFVEKRYAEQDPVGRFRVFTLKPASGVPWDSR
ncbi:MAG: hypothetical protein MUF27_04445 [Acidobacteria bacterium]|nr:hypothetical protein [Acidobacteriota bacterium]